MGLSRIVSEINGDFTQKSQISQPRLFNATADMVPLELGTGAKIKKTRMMELPESFKISLAV